jgi:5-hydroxyisourate hydrolase
MSTISTHVLDTAHGRPAAGVPVTLEVATADGWDRVGQASTDADGRAPGLLSGDSAVHPGVHRLVFDTGAWFAERGVAAFYPRVIVTFEIADATDHYHVPLLLSPFGYSTYRGS